MWWINHSCIPLDKSSTINEIGDSLHLLLFPAPNQLYIMPLTDSQQYGWMMSKSPEPWTRVKRFPRKNSEMTK